MIHKNQAVNRWFISDIERKPFQSKAKTFYAPVNPGEEYIPVLYPVREAFLEKMPINQISLGDVKKVCLTDFYFPFENNRVEFTTFIHTPHYISFSGETKIYVERDCELAFELYTCGGVKLWVNEELATSFTPYSRNIGSLKKIKIKCKKGENTLHLYADELAERDVIFYIELRYVDTEPLVGIVHMNEDDKMVQHMENFLESLYFERDVYAEGDMILNYNPDLVQSDIELQILGLPSPEDRHKIRQYTVKKGTHSLCVSQVLDVAVGMFKVDVKIDIGRLAIKRRLVVGNYCHKISNDMHANTIYERKKQALAFLSRHGENFVMKTIAILETQGRLTDEAQEILETTIKKIEKKEDCADFYLGTMIHLLKHYRNFLSDETVRQIKRVLLDFRYWIDEPGNDVMWYFSENHALLFHVGQYLAGDYFEDEVFSVSGRKGKKQKEIGKKRLVHWFDHFFKYGLGEWNSVTYVPVDMIGFFNLYDQAPDDDIKQLAKKALDFLFKLMAYHNYNGIISSSYGRVYEETLKARELSEPSFIEWITSGKGFMNFRIRAVVMYGVSSYVPSDYYQEIALRDDEGAVIELTQGQSHAHLYTYMTDDYALSCVQGYKPFTQGHQQHIMNLAMSGDSTQLFINHPGEKPISGEQRPSYWAGNGMMPLVRQFRNAMLMVFNIDERQQVHFIHTYMMPERMDEFICQEKELYLKVKDTYVYIRFSHDVKITTYGAATGKECISNGRHHGVYIKCGAKKEWGSFHAFKKSMKETVFEYNGETELKIIDPHYGTLEIRDDQCLYRNGKVIEQAGKHEIHLEKVLRVCKESSHEE